jgi:DNA-directed RNA polymerase
LVNNNKKFWIGDVWLFAKLLTELNDKAIAETVKGARIGQNFLKEVTFDLVKQGRHVFYTTPITNFPVLQKINKSKVEKVNSPIGFLSIRTQIDELHQSKMVNGIAPNYIHSLDATLLASTVLKLTTTGCDSFHLIHDSYGVPVTYVPDLNVSVREAFVELFKAYPLERWLSQVYEDYPKQVDEVMINTLDLDEVINSRYIFS